MFVSRVQTGTIFPVRVVLESANKRYQIQIPTNPIYTPDRPGQFLKKVTSATTSSCGLQHEPKLSKLGSSRKALFVIPKIFNETNNKCQVKSTWQKEVTHYK